MSEKNHCLTRCHREQARAYKIGLHSSLFSAPLQTHAHTPGNGSTTHPKTDSTEPFHPAGAFPRWDMGRNRESVGSVRGRHYQTPKPALFNHYLEQQQLS